MKTVKLREMTSSQLVERFADIALQQDRALLGNETGKFNRLYGQMDEVEGELKLRPGDQRRLLISLYTHPNAQVRLKAAARTLAVAPQERGVCWKPSRTLASSPKLAMRECSWLASKTERFSPHEIARDARCSKRPRHPRACWPALRHVCCSLRELPDEFENLTITDIWNIAKGGDARARTCRSCSRNCASENERDNMKQDGLQRLFSARKGVNARLRRAMSA
jgi:hypothetical protein